MIFNFILANLVKWGERLDVNIYFKTYKLTLKRKKAKPRVNAKKSNNTALSQSALSEWNPGEEEVF